MANNYDFKGSNKQGTRALFESRKRYRDEALFDAEEDQFHTGVEDFFTGIRKWFTARIDDESKFVGLNASRASYFDSKLRKTGTGTSESPRAADFVVDAYRGFFREFETAVREGRCGIDASTLKIEVVSAWMPISTLRRAVQEAMRQQIGSNIFVRENGQTINANVNDLERIEDFLEKALFFMGRALKVAPITSSSLMSSKIASPACTGLVLTLDKSSFDDDAKKSEYMNQEVFELYRLAAQKHGFVVNKNAPWQLMANLDSTAMQSYMEERNTTKETLFSTHYSVLEYNEVEHIKRFIVNVWNSFARANPYCRRRIPTCNFKRTIPEVAKRKQYTMKEINKKFDSAYWIGYYVVVKFAENGYSVDELTPFMKKMIKDARELQKNVDMLAAIGYINDQFTDSRLRTRLAPSKFLPGAEPLEKGQVSQYQSNVIIETTDY
ncbi:MAG TPA: hypothetical protein DEQ32_13525 [Gammaproteobacteria bacterium]|nr:hypothetical protein [Gammaproteobacteria bacterium]|tara:strand:- start:129 stop:1445 length:1317 start_codon:yes stop_codon:yes gene_type:complete